MKWPLDAFYPGDELTLLVFNLLIQMTAVILLTMFVARKFLRRAAAARHAAWLACLAFVGACPLITFAAHRAGVSVVSLHLASREAATAGAEVSAVPLPPSDAAIATANRDEPQPAVPGRRLSSATGTVEPWISPTAEEPRFETIGQVTPLATEPRRNGPGAPAGAGSTTSSTASRLSFRSTVSIALGIWATGSLLFAVRLLHGGIYLRGLARKTIALDESGLVDVLRRVRRSLGVTDLPPILLSEHITTPVVAGLPGPVILLPASLPESISRDSLHDVLVHECAHIFRRDHWVGVLQRLVETVYWFHPLVHQMNRRLACCREEVCDNHVLSAVGASDYADTLLGLTVHFQSRVGTVGSMGMFGLNWRLEDRVRGLLDGRRDPSVKLGYRSRLAVAVWVCAILAAAATRQINTAAGERDDKHREDEVLLERALGDESKKPSADAQASGQNQEVLDVDGNPQKPGSDLDGEPLPRGSVARLGSRRLRHEGYRRRIWMLPDSQTLISSNRDSGVLLWNADTGKLLRELDLRSNDHAVANLSYDGKSLAVLTMKIDTVKRESACELRLWDTSTWQARPVGVWTGSTYYEKCVAVSPDATTVATSNERGNIRFWDVASGEELLNYSIAERQIESLAFSPDGILLAIALRDGVFLWDWLSGEVPRPLRSPVENTQAVTFSPDGRLLATGSQDEFAARIWDVASGQMLLRLKGESDYYRKGLMFSSDGKSLIVPAGRTKTVEIFDVETGRLRQSLDAGALEPRDVAISTDGRLLAAIGSEARIKLWSLPEGRSLTDRFIGHDEAANEVAFTPNGQQVVTGSRDGTIRVWEADTGRQLRSVGPHGWVTDLTVSPDGKKIASCGLDETVRLWDFESGREIFTLPGHGRLGGNDDYTVGFTPDGKRFLSFGLDMYLRVWSTQTGKALVEHAIRPSGLEFEETEDGGLRLADTGEGPLAISRFWRAPRQAHFTADAERLFLSDRHTVYLFDVESGREIDTWTTEESLHKFRVSPDGGKLVTVKRLQLPPDPDSQAKRPQFRVEIHRLPSKEKVGEVNVKGGFTRALAFSSDSRLLATTITTWKPDEPSEYWISLWDLETCGEVAHIDGYDKSVSQIAFSADGKRLASTLSDTTTLVWDLGQFHVE